MKLNIDFSEEENIDLKKYSDFCVVKYGDKMCRIAICYNESINDSSIDYGTINKVMFRALLLLHNKVQEYCGYSFRFEYDENSELFKEYSEKIDFLLMEYMSMFKMSKIKGDKK